ncbi:hypothetical protein ACET3Z_031732 [Daucus carota]
MEIIVQAGKKSTFHVRKDRNCTNKLFFIFFSEACFHYGRVLLFCEFRLHHIYARGLKRLETSLKKLF